MASENSLNMVHDIGPLSNDVVHTVCRPYKCTFCTKTFRVHSNLVKHTRTHTGERPFKCEVCEKAFANPSNLTRHRRLHAGIRPYTCGFCQKGFRDRSNLKYHLKTHLNDTSFKCQECGDVFSAFADYCAHMKVHFDITSELLNNSHFPSPHSKASTSQTDSALMNNNPASSSFPSFTSSNSCPSEEIWRLSLMAASSIGSDVQNYNNSCDIASLNKSSVNGHQNFSSFKNKTSQGIVECNSIIPNLQSSAGSKDFNSNYSANQVNREPKLLSVNPRLKDLISSQTKSAVEIVDLDDQVSFPKQETPFNVSEENTGMANYSILPSFTGEKDWNLFSIKDTRLDDIDADVVRFEQGYQKPKSPVFQFGHLDQPEEIGLRDDSTCTLDELANKLTQCGYCERIFSLEDSSKQDGNEKPYCGTCDKMSASRSHLTANSPSPQEKNLLCMLCDTMFEEPGQLKQHICVTNINGKRYNPCLKSPRTMGSKNFKESDSLESDLVVHYEDPLRGIKVLGPLSSCESQNLMADSLFVKEEKTQEIGAANDELKNPELSKENSNEAKPIVLRESNMESAELVMPAANEDNDEVIIIENIWEKSSRKDDTINAEKGKCAPTKLIQSTPVEMNVLQDESLHNKNVFIIDSQVDLNPGKSVALVNDPVELCKSKDSLTIKNPKNNGNDSRCAGRKNSDACSTAKSKVNRPALNKSRKLLRNRLKNPLQQPLSKEQEKPGLFRSSRDVRFKCRYCDKAFSVQGNLRKHIRTHTGEKPFKCTFCPTAFANPSNLTRHIRTHTGEKPYKCPHCERTFRASSNLRSHQRTHFKYVQYKCNVCQEKFSVVSRYRSHLKSHQNQPGPNHVSANTSNVPGIQVNADNLINNLNTSLLFRKQNPKPQVLTFVSNDDNSDANVSDVDNRSLRLRQKERAGRSEKVQPAFSSALNDSFDFSNQFIQNLHSQEEGSSLRQPDLWQERLDPVQTDSWQTRFKSEDQNSKQINRDNIIVIDLGNNSLGSYGRPDSDGAAGFSADLLNDRQVEHLSVRNGQVSDKFSKNRCFENFRKSHKTSTLFNKNFNLESSNEISLGRTKLQNCKSAKSISLKSLSSSTVSKSHPYRCVYCSKGFTVHCNLVKHIRIHTGEKPFSCKDCGKAFANPSNLTRHLRTHTGERPYKCSLCSCTFRSSSNLKIHMNSHSSATRQIKCSLCDQIFNRKEELKIHLRTHVTDRKIKGSSSNGTKTNFVKSLNGGRRFSSSSTVIPSFWRFKNPSGFAKQNLALKNPIVGRTTLPREQKMLRNSTFIQESTNNNPVRVDKFHSDSFETISSKISPKGPAGRSQFVKGKENTSKFESLGSKTKEASLTNYNNAASDIVALNNRDVPNRLLTAKHEFLTLQTSLGKDHVQIEKESCLNEVQSNALVDCPEQTMTSRLEEGENGKIASFTRNMQNPQTMTNLSPKIKFERENLLSVLETAEPTETSAAATHTATATVSIRTSKLHKCRFCGRMFPSRCNLIKHVRTHTGEKPFRCKCCRAAFANPSNLTRHVRTHTGEKPYSCPHCSKTFRASSNLKQHLRTHREANPYKCRYCSRTFFMLGNLKLHLRSHGKPGPNSKVSADLGSSSSLPHSSQKYFHSKSSAFANNDRSDYDNVPPKHSVPSQRIFKDPQGGKMTRLKQKEATKALEILNRTEQLSQSSKANDDVDSCNAVYSVKFVSSAENVGENKDLLVCEPINYSGRDTEQDLTPVFSNVETTSTPVNDDNQPNHLTWPESLTKRADIIVVPTFRRKPKKYKCVYCEKTFNVSSNLTKHVRTHTGEKPFQCRFCTKAFANPSNLNRHERIHTGERPYQCPYCTQRFAASGNLKEHVKKHVSSAPDDLFHSESLSQMVDMKRKQKMVKEKYSNSKTLYRDNFIASTPRVKQTLSLLTESASSGAKDSENFSPQDNSKNEGNQLNILDQSFEKGESSRNRVASEDSETGSLTLNRNEELSVFSFDSLILNSLKKSVAGSDSANENHIKQEELTQERDCASSNDFCSEPAEINNDGQETVKEEGEDNGEAQEFKDPTCVQNDLLALFNRNSMDPLNDERGMNPTEVSEMTQSMNSVLCKKEFPDSTSANPNSFENSFSHPHKEGSYQCQMCHLTFGHCYELNQHMEIHALSSEIEIKYNVSNNEEFSKSSLDYEANSRENSLENTENENASFVNGELYICKYGCQTFASYAELNSHLKIHAKEDKVLINNDVCIDDDNFQQNNDQKENSLILDSLNPQPQQMSVAAVVVPPSLVELDLYGCGPFMSPLDSDQHLMVELTQPNISPTESSASSSSQSRPEKPHQCPFCIKSFSKGSQLTKHIRTHTGETPHKCCYCGTGFANPSNLTRHIRTHTGEKPYKCPICKKAFGNSSNMKEHLKTHSKISLYKCKYCRKKFSIFNTYRTHLKSHYKGYRTVETNKKEESPMNIVIDNNSNSSEEIVEIYNQTNDKTLFSLLTGTQKYERDRYNFDVSDLSISEQNEVREIIKTNDTTSSNYSPIVYLNDTAEASQVVNETFASYYESPASQKQPEQLINLVDFYRTFSPSHKEDSNSLPNEHRANSKSANANQSKAFTSLSGQALRSHICKYCGKSFSIHSNLTKHIRTHTGEKPFKCHTCGAAFANPSNLTRHVRTHTGEKPYLCPHCSKSFRASSNLKVHLKMIHTQN